jgi:predicted transcriptional regulator
MLLFSRIHAGHELENPVRQRVLEAIRASPGLCIAEVCAQLDIAWGTAVHHLNRLARAGLTVSVRQGGARRHFVANTPESRNRCGIAALAHPTAQRIARLVERAPGIDQTGVCRELGLHNPAASKHLGRFASLGLVTAQRAGRCMLYRGTQALSAALTAGKPAPLLGTP